MLLGVGSGFLLRRANCILLLLRPPPPHRAFPLLLLLCHLALAFTTLLVVTKEPCRHSGTELTTPIRKPATRRYSQSLAYAHTTGYSHSSEQEKRRKLHSNQ